MQEIYTERVYVAVDVHFREHGDMLPRLIIWEDGTRYEVDKVIAVQQSAALKSGGQGDRYTVQILGKRTFLFFERNGSVSGSNIGRWFVERRYVVDKRAV